MSWFGRGLLPGVLWLAVLETAIGGSPQIVLSRACARQIVPWAFFPGDTQEELIRHSPNPIDLSNASRKRARLEDRGAAAGFLHSLFAGQGLDFIEMRGAPEVRFAQRYRAQFLPRTLAIAGIPEQCRIGDSAPTSNDAVVAGRMDQGELVKGIPQALSDTTRIAWTVGAYPAGRCAAELPRASHPFSNGAGIAWCSDLPFAGAREQVAALPAHSAIFGAVIDVAAAGVSLDDERARLRGMSTPNFAGVDGDLGQGIVGGPVLSGDEFNRGMAARYVGILGSETSESIEATPLRTREPAHDWRKLQSWLREARLPPGGIVRFRDRTGWERYRWPVVGALSVLSLQAGMVTWLLLERRGRRKAEVEARRRSLEVMHLSRTAEAGALSASFAHELSQPLASIMLGTDAAEMLLEAEPSNVMRMREILGDIRQANEHAAEIIAHVKKLLKRRGKVEPQEFDLHGAIADAMQILLPEAKKQRISLRAIGVQQRLPVRADRIHLQQVILNLARNAMDAMTGIASDARRMTIQTAVLGESMVEVSVSDSGTGIPEHKLGEIFNTFYTTKEHGTGLGLSIARTIVETYGGKIWAENRAGGGAVLRFTLPLSHHTVSRDRLAPRPIG